MASKVDGNDWKPTARGYAKSKRARGEGAIGRSLPFKSDLWRNVIQQTPIGTNEVVRRDGGRRRETTRRVTTTLPNNYVRVVSCSSSVVCSAFIMLSKHCWKYTLTIRQPNRYNNIRFFFNLQNVWTPRANVPRTGIVRLTGPRQRAAFESDKYFTLKPYVVISSYSSAIRL